MRKTRYYDEENRPVIKQKENPKVKYIYEDLVNPKTGKIETKLTGTEDFDEKMQEDAKSQILENIIKRYQIDLNDKHITEISKETIDMTKMPENLLEAYAIAQNLEKQFNSAPADFKKKFGNFTGFLKDFSDGKLENSLNELASDRLKTQRKIEEERKIKAEKIKEQTETKNENKGVNYDG